jgi:hypothetical protein
MYDFLLKLNFRNAGVFNKSWTISGDSRDGDDRIYEWNKRRDRKKSDWIEPTFESIHVSFINNVIHVLCGLRPKSKYRQTIVKQQNNITEIAQRSFVKIESLILRHPKSNKNISFETQQTIKCIPNCWNINTTLSWLRMKYWLTNQLYEMLIVIANNYCNNNALSLPIENVIDILRLNNKNSDIQDLIKLSLKDKCTDLAHLLQNNEYKHHLQQAGYNGLGAFLKTLVTKSIAKITRIDGNIYIPLFKEELELFEHGTGYATLFDGGIVLINDIIDLSNTTLEYQIIGLNKVEI